MSVILYTMLQLPCNCVSSLRFVGGDAEQTAKEMIFEAQSQLNKQQQAEHGGAVRGTDAARVQVLLMLIFLDMSIQQIHANVAPSKPGGPKQ